MNLRLRIGNGMARVVSVLRLGGVTRGFLSTMPRGLQLRMDAWHRRFLAWNLEHRVRGGHELVPAEALERRYCELLQDLIDAWGTRELGDYLEFGVGRGTSLACMHRALKSLSIEGVRLFGFDSFEGLPESARDDDEGAWLPGQFRFSEERTRSYLTSEGVDWDRTTIEPGWFSETLTDDFVAAHEIRKASVVLIDCDTYLSARESLAFCAPLIRDRTVLLFDDWYTAGLGDRNLGERRAFDEFMDANPELTAARLDSYGPYSEVLIVSRR